MRACLWVGSSIPDKEASYQFNAREDFIKRVFAPAYSSDTSSITPYKLSSLYSILCLGALYDLSRPIYAQESREYMEIAQSLLMSAIGQWEVSMDSIEVKKNKP